jgi:hypothetical protein
VSLAPPQKNLMDQNSVETDTAEVSKETQIPANVLQKYENLLIQFTSTSIPNDFRCQRNSLLSMDRFVLRHFLRVIFELVFSAVGGVDEGSAAPLTGEGSRARVD